MEVFHEMVPIEDLPPVAWGGYLFDHLPDAFMPIAKTGNRVRQRLLIDPLGQPRIVLKPSSPGLFVQTDPFIFLPDTWLAKWCSQPDLATVHTQFLHRLFQVRQRKGLPMH